jgi:protein TonB
VPEFPGEDVALLRYINDNLRYPAAAIKDSIQGMVTCHFIVEKDGSVTNVEVVRGVNSRLDAEVVRVMKNLPKFKPGLREDQPVRVIYTVPVRFRLHR